MPKPPRTITIIRHGEKPDEDDPTRPPLGIDHEGRPDEHSLIPQGWTRAGALCALLTSEEVRPPFVRPTVLVASALEPGESRRNLDTLLPLSQRLGLPVSTPAAKGEEERLVEHVLAQAGADVLVCWSHEEIGQITTGLAAALGAADLPPAAEHWPDDDFWTALVFTRDDDACTVVQTSERLLAGDAD